MEWPNFKIPTYIPFSRLIVKLNSLVTGSTLRNYKNQEEIDNLLSRLSPENLGRVAHETFKSRDDNTYRIFNVLVKVCSGHCVRMLIETYGADPSLQDIEGRNALIHAVHSDNTSTAKVILDIGKVDIECTDVYGNTPICFVQSVEMVDLLVQHNANVRPAKNLGGPLYLLLCTALFDVALALVNYGADVNEAGGCPVIELSLKHYRGHPIDSKFIEVLFSKGVDCTRKNLYGYKTLMRYAINACTYTKEYNFVDTILSRGYVPEYEDFCYAIKVKNVNHFLSMFTVVYFLYRDVLFLDKTEVPSLIEQCDSYGLRDIVYFLICVLQDVKHDKSGDSAYAIIVNNINPDYPTLFDMLYARCRLYDRFEVLFPNKRLALC